MVSNVRVQQLPLTSVRVTWQATVGVPELTGYTVYYRHTLSNGEAYFRVSNHEDSAVITGLVSDAMYQFQVVAMAEVDGVTLMGMRSLVSLESIAILTETQSG